MTIDKAVSLNPSKPPAVLPYETKLLSELYFLDKKLGQGQFGVTYLCINKSTGDMLACKSIAKKKLIRKEDCDGVYREIKIMHHLSSISSVVSIRGGYEDAQSVHLVMELCAGGELFERILRKGHYSEREAAKLMKTVIRILEDCHSHGVMHRDLKPENFLFKNKHEDSPLKVIDFELSTFFQPGDTFKDRVGSPLYVAPEVLKKSYGPEADIWSAGVILYLLLSGAPPFFAETCKDIFVKILGGTVDLVSKPWQGVSDNAKDLIKKMLEKDPKRRLTAYQVLCHPWMADESTVPDKPLDSVVLSRLKQFSAMNKLKKMACRVIAEKLSEEEIGGLKELFQKIDGDNSGTVTFDELKHSLQRLDCKLLESDIEDLMNAADVDENGTLDYREFLSATVHLNKLEREENLVQAFTFFDRDRSGYITIDEFKQACKGFGMNDLHLEEMIKEIDQNNDGMIDYGEFVAMMRKGNGVAGGRRTMGDMNWADALGSEEASEE